MSRCRSCGAERDLSPLPASEVLAVVVEALRVAGDQTALLDLVAARAPSAVGRLQVAALAVRLLAAAGEPRSVISILASAVQVERLEEWFASPSAGGPDR